MILISETIESDIFRFDHSRPEFCSIKSTRRPTKQLHKESKFRS